MSQPVHIDLKKDRGLTIQWDDGATSYYSIRVFEADVAFGGGEAGAGPVGDEIGLRCCRRGGKGWAAGGGWMRSWWGTMRSGLSFRMGIQRGLYSWGYLLH